MEKGRKNDAVLDTDGKSLVRTGFAGGWDNFADKMDGYGKDVDKKFLYVGKYVESVTNRVESSFFAYSGRKMTVLTTHI